MNATVAMALAAGAGLCIALQASANSRFSRAIGEPVWVTFLSICGTITFATLAMLAMRPPAPTWESLRNTEWWYWIGGPLGTMIVMSGIFLVPHLGAARFIACVVAGQLFTSLLLDHLGLMGLKPDPISLGKIGGALLIVLGVICIKYFQAS